MDKPVISALIVNGFFKQKGSILCHQGKYEEAVKAYKEGLFVAKENGIKDEKAEQLYGNMICCLSEYGSYQSIDTALSELHTYFPKVYSQTLFSLSSVFEKNKRYKDAIEYISRAIPLVNGNVKEQYEWYKNFYSHEYDNQQQLILLLKNVAPNRVVFVCLSQCVIRHFFIDFESDMVFAFTFMIV